MEEIRVSVSARIREWLASQDGPRSSRAMAAAVGVETIKAQSLVGQMLRAGMVVEVGHEYPRVYALVRDAMSMQEASQLAAEGRRRANASEDRRRAREARKQDAANKRREERTRALLAAQAERRKPHRAGRELQIVQKQDAPAFKPCVRAQTVEEWLASGGRIQRLAQHEMSPGWRLRA